MPLKVKTAQRARQSRRFPIRCKTWQQVEEIKRKYLKPKRYGPKGQPIYDLDEVTRYVVFPSDE